MPPAQHLLAESGVDAPEDDDIETNSEGPQIARTNSRSLRVARLGDRAVAAMLDSSLLIAAFTVLNTWALMRWGMSDGTECHITLAVVLFATFWDAVIFFIYFWVSEAFFGTTAGKAITGIVVVNQSQHKTIAASAVRNSIRFIDGLGFYLLGALVASCSKAHKRIGDVVAKTVVVEKDLSLGKRAAALLLWVVVFCGAALMMFNMWTPEHVATSRPAHFSRVIATAGRTYDSEYVTFSSTRLEFRVTEGKQENTNASGAR